MKRQTENPQRTVPGSGAGFLDLIKSRIEENITMKKALFQHAGIIQEMARIVIRAYGNGGKVFLFGNGGSAADAQHIAAELSGRLYLERAPLPAEALSVNTSLITAIGNDYSFEKVFARQLEANGREKDVAVGISTSGDSKNVIEGINSAKRMRMATIALTGDSGGQLGNLVDCCLRVPSKDTARIQESHIMVGHIVCELVERELFGEQPRS